ncbi:hypothetical protein B296_00036864 [Ensete ventricosum]|uniref:Uncharacterized protein n=1 Tax=Ensete ventricosum TaxID=4639 RepID=A0A427A152_ENSVE|nr:hypothetical protein B296_00036864 [Ensete ventricosum]
MSEADTGAGESLLSGPRELRHVSEGGNGNRTVDAVRTQGRRDPVHHPEHIDANGNVAVLEVPKHCDLHVLAFILVMPPRQGRGGERGRRNKRPGGRGGRGGQYMGLRPPRRRSIAGDGVDVGKMASPPTPEGRSVGAEAEELEKV